MDPLQTRDLSAVVPTSEPTTTPSGVNGADTTGTDPVPPYVGGTSEDEAPPGYELLGELGRGGMGVVYQARQRGLNRLVALKVVLGGYRAGTRERIRFIAEAEAVAAIRHPHVVQVYEYGEHGDRPYLAMEFLPGGSLADRLKVGHRLDPAEAAVLVGKLSAAVQAAHDQQIVHRDLKPANVLFDAADEPKVTDFGLAKRPTDSDLTTTGAVMGTPAYMSPEQATGQTKFVGPPADVWALGVILYECLTGTRPFDGDTPLGVIAKVAGDQPESPRRRVPGLPRDLVLICLKCLEKNPADRYPTAAALADDLRQFAAGEPVSVRATGMVERAAKWARRKPTLATAYALGSLAVLLGGSGLGAAWLWQEAVSARNDLAGEQQATAAALAREKVAKAGEAEARGKAEAAGKKLAWVEYGRTLQVAYEAWRTGDYATAGQLLAETQPELRGWEWQYLHRLCHPDLLTVAGISRSSVFSAAFSPDGTRVAVAVGTDGPVAGSSISVSIWDAHTGRKLLELIEPRKRGTMVAVAFSPDGSRIAAGGMSPEVAVWDAHTGRLLQTLAARNTARLAWNPQGTRLAVAERAGEQGDGLARVWDVETGKAVLTLTGHKMLYAVAWNPDGTTLATAGADRTVRTWASGDGKPIRTLDVAGRIDSLAWSLDGTKLAAAGTGAYVWDAKTGNELLARAGPGLSKDLWRSVAWSPDGTRLGIASYSRAQIWDSSTGAVLRELKGHGGYTQDAASLRENTPVPRPGSSSPAVTSIAFDNTGNRVVTSGGDGTVRIWDTRPEAWPVTLEGGRWNLDAAYWSPRGDRIAARYSSGSGEGARSQLSIWEARTGRNLLSIPNLKRIPAGVFDQGFASVAWSPDGTRLAAPDGLVAQVWDAQTGKGLARLSGHTQPITQVAWSPEGTRLATVTQDDSTTKAAPNRDLTARVWDAHTGRELLQIPAWGGNVAWTEDGSGLVTNQEKDDSGVERTHVRVDQSVVSLITAQENNKYRLWDAATGKEVAPGERDPAIHVLRAHGRVNRDGTRAAILNSDGRVHLLDAQTGAEVAVLRGVVSTVESATWTPDGSRIVTTHGNGTIRIWECETGAHLLALAWEHGFAGPASFNPDGSRLLVPGTQIVSILDCTPVNRTVQNQPPASAQK